MTAKETAALEIARTIATLGRQLDGINKNFPPGDHHQFSSLLSCNATAEQFCLPPPDAAQTVFAKHLRGIASDIPAIAPAITDLIASLKS